MAHTGLFLGRCAYGRIKEQTAGSKNIRLMMTDVVCVPAVVHRAHSKSMRQISDQYSNQDCIQTRKSEVETKELGFIV